MRINPISKQNFRAFITNDMTKFSSEQKDILNDISTKSSKVSDKFNDDSLLSLLKIDYDMDLYADANSDKKSVNLYLSENSNLKKGISSIPRLTFIGKFNKEEEFDPIFAIDKVEKTIFGKDNNFLNNLATIICSLGILVVPVISLITLAKERNTEKIENVIKHATDTLKETPKDTLNITKKLLK